MSAIQAMPRHRPAKGSPDRCGRTTIACRFDEALFEQIQTLAIAQNIAFAEQVRILAREALKRRAEARARG